MRLFLAAIALVGMGAWASAAPDRQRIDGLPPSEISALQQRLADAKCYSGPIDGQASEATKAAVNACPDQRPQLRIETGMHVAVINRIGVDQDCRLAATASDDKTVRLWSLPAGDLLRTLRWPIGAGDGGKAYATAVSPDGRTVAVSGWDAEYEVLGRNAATIFDAATGAVVARVGGFENVIDQLAFSPDGRWLAATLHGGKGLRVIDTATWREVAADTAYGGDSYGAAFAPDGRLYTVAYDGKLRRYGPGPAFRKEAEVATAGGKRPFSVAVDPGGTRLAVGFYDGTAVALYDAPSLRPRRPADTRGIDNGDLGTVAWSRDGRTLVAGGAYDESGTDPLLLFDRDGRRRGTAPLAASTIMNLQACGAGFAATAGDPAFGLVSANGRKDLWREGVAADMRGKLGTAFSLAADAKRVRFGLGYGAATPVSFDLARATLTDSPTVEDGLAPPRTDGLPVTDWVNKTAPLFDGRQIKLETHDISRSLAVRPYRDGFVLGTSYRLSAFDGAGAQRWQQPVPGDAWGVNLSADGRIVVAAYGDGTIRWHRWSDGQELLALFVNKQTRAWVAWTPSGYYMASPGGEDMIGWHVNRGWDQAADFFPASRFRDTFARPDIVRKVLTTFDEAEAIRQANIEGGQHKVAAPIIERLPPVVTILEPRDGTSVAPGAVAIRYSARSPSGGKVDRVEVFIDGAKTGTRGLARVDAPKVDTASALVTIDMPAHDAEISLVAYEGGRAGDAVKIALKAATSARAADPDSLKPTLYALVVGVGHYSDRSYDLAYPAADAVAFADALRHQQGRFYKNVVVKVLKDGEATSTAFKEGLYWLKEQMTDRDLAVVFAAGHGTTDAKNKFWFLTTDANSARLLTSAVSRDDIADILYDLPGKKLLFLDACHAGAALNTGVRGEGTDLSLAVQDFAQAEGGVVAYAASTGREFSRESDQWGHGFFTQALLEAIGQGKADLLNDGIITTATLDAYLANRVKQLSGGQQHPTMTRPKTVPDFPLALAR